MTGELTWDYGRQLVTVGTPKTQAIIGHAGGEPVELPGVSATVKTPFVSLILTPLDDKPLAESKARADHRDGAGHADQHQVQRRRQAPAPDRRPRRC